MSVDVARLRRELEGWRRAFVAESGGRKPSKEEIKALGLPYARMRLQDWAKQAHVEESASPRRPKTSAPSDAPDEPGAAGAIASAAAAAAPADTEQAALSAAPADAAKGTTARPKRMRRHGRIDGGFKPVNRVVPTVKDPSEVVPDVVEPGLASWNRSSDDIAESLALQAQPRGGWKKPKSVPVVGPDALAPAATVLEREPSPAASPASLAHPNADRHRPSKYASVTLTASERRTATKQWHPGGDDDQEIQEPDWDEIQEMEREAAEAQSYIEAQQQSQPQPQPLRQTETETRYESKPMQPTRHLGANETVADAADKVHTASAVPDLAARPPVAKARAATRSRAGVAQKKSTALRTRRATRETRCQEELSESGTDSDESPVDLPSFRARSGRTQQPVKYQEAGSDSSGTDSGSDFDDEVRKASRRKRQRKQPQVRMKTQATEGAPKSVQGPTSNASHPATSAARQRRLTGKLPSQSSKRMKVVPKANEVAMHKPVAAAPHVAGASSMCTDDQRTNTAAVVRMDEKGSGGSDSGAAVQQPDQVLPAKRVVPEKQKAAAEKVTYDQLGRRRVKWKPPASARSGEVSQNFRRLGNVNRRSTNRQIALRNGHSTRGGGRGRSNRGGRSARRGRGGSNWSSNSDRSSYHGATSDKHSAEFSADPYGVMGAGKLGSLLLSNPPASIQSDPHAARLEDSNAQQQDGAMQNEHKDAPKGTKRTASAGLDFSQMLAGKVSVLRPKDKSLDCSRPLRSSTQTPLQPSVDAATEERLRKVLQVDFNHNSFREGQAWAIDRVLRPTVSSNQSTLAILPTGAGKSLCYQVAAFVMRPKVTLVISPLVSLMQDQLLNLPAGLRGDCITSNQKWTKNKKALEALSSRQLDILFIAPERLYDEKFLRRLSELEPDSIGLLCVDEAHCVSQWSHNFRPGYLRLDLIFRKQLGIDCPLLGLTATATAMTERSIREKLNIPKEGVWRSSTLRPNLHLTVSIESNRRAALVDLLRSEHFAKAKSVIVYAFYRLDVDELTRHLQGHMIKADGYHAGKDPSVREKIQNDFMNGKLHVVVATVAFGMGINKQDVGGVVHYSLPGSMEGYVQEVGRAGRDGSPAYCHLFLNTGDYMRRRSLASSDGLDQITVLSSLRALFKTNVCKQEEQERVNQWRETEGGDSYVAPEYSGGWKRLVSCTEDQAKQDYDTSIDVLLTCFTYLEIGQPRYLRVLSVNTNLTYTVQFFKSTVEQLVKLSPVVNCVVQSGKRRQSKYEFDLASVCNLLRMSTSDLLSALQQLKSNGEIQFEPKAQGVLAEVVIEPSDVDLKHVAEALHRKTSQLEKNNVEKIDALYKVMVHFAKGGADCDASSDADGAGPPTNEKDQRDQMPQSLDKRVDIQQIIDRYFAHYDEDEGEQTMAHGASEQNVAQLPYKEICQRQEQHGGAGDLKRDPWEDYKAAFKAAHDKCSDKAEFNGNGKCTDGGNEAAAQLSTVAVAKADPPLQRQMERSESSTGAKQLRAQLLGDISAFCRAHRNAIAPSSSASTSSSSAGSVGSLTGRAIARIFHGLTSPQYPAYEWGRDPYWGRHNTADFNLLLSLANKTVEAMQRKRDAQDKADAAARAAKVKRAAQVVAAHAAQRAEQEGLEGGCAGAGAVLVFASDSEDEDEDEDEEAKVETDDDIHVVTNPGEADLSAQAGQHHEDDQYHGDDGIGDDEHDAVCEEEYDSEEI